MARITFRALGTGTALLDLFLTAPGWEFRTVSEETPGAWLLEVGKAGASSGRCACWLPPAETQR